MSNDVSEKVTRYCPECGRKFVANEQQFAEPRVCPACKTRVLFLPFQHAPPPPDIDDRPADNRDLGSLTKFASVGIAVAGSGVVFFAALAAVITANFSLLFIVSCVFLIVGVICVMVVLDYSTKAKLLRENLQQRERQLRESVDNQRRYLTLYYGMKNNFDKILEDERQALNAQLQALIDQAAEELQTAEKTRQVAEHDASTQHQQFEERKQTLETATKKIAERMLTELRKSIKSKLNAQNFATCKERFLSAVDFCNKHGYTVPEDSVTTFLKDLHDDYEKAVRAQIAKEEQARIRERMREEAKAEKELAKELQRIEAEEKAIQKAIDEAMERAAGEHSAELDSLRERLADAEARAERAKSMAQVTKAGHVYVISNIGSFGEHIFKIGMTRRLKPEDRVKELGDASVPFPFDVHMMISSDDAPKLESALHREFHHRRVNRINFRKEYFNVSVDEIATVVHRECGEVDYVIDPEAIEYRESQSLSEEDFEMISSQVDPESLPED